MRVRTISSAVAALMILAACDTLPTGPSNEPPARALSASHAASRDASPTGVTSQCDGQAVALINTTWPWAHEDKGGFAPPPGAIAIWLQDLGPFLGVQTVREAQTYFCSP